jgi:uncharacterized protein (DUF1501 family)
MTIDISRRGFMQAAGAVGVIGASHGLFPSWMPKLVFSPTMQQGPGDVLVHIFLRGGMDGLSAVVPYSEGAYYYDARPTLAVPEPGRGPGSALDLDGRFGLHPTLAPLKEIYDEGDLALVHATGLTDPTRSHFDAMRFMEYGIPGDKTVGTGWIGRHLQSAAWRNDSPFRAVGMGTMLPDVLRGPVTPLAIKSIADFHFRGRDDELRRLQHSLSSLYAMDAGMGGPQGMLSQQADLVFETIDVLQALDAGSYAPSAGAVYPEDEEGFGMGLKQVAQLIKADVGLEVASIDLGGWDTHEAQGVLDGQMNSLLGYLAQGLHAFYADLGERMQGVTVVVMSEFGRTIDENGSAGTDHGHGNAMFLMGGGVKGGQVFGPWPGMDPAHRDDSDDLAITTDYRNVVAEVVKLRLGNPALDAVFPNFTPAPLGLFEGRG